MNAPIVEQLGIPMTGGGPRWNIAARVVLGIEMGFRRRLLGYEGEGSWQAHRGDAKSGNRRKWDDYCKEEAGITETMVRHYLECADAVGTRLALLSGKLGNGPKRVLKLMGKQPSTLTPRQRQALFEGIFEYGIFEADTQSSLRKEFRARRTDKPLNLPTPLELKAQIDEHRKDQPLPEWITTDEPRAIEFRQKMAQLYLRQKRENENRSMARILGISAETMEAVQKITETRRLLAAAREDGGESYNADQLYELAKRKGIMA